MNLPSTIKSYFYSNYCSLLYLITFLFYFLKDENFNSLSFIYVNFHYFQNQAQCFLQIASTYLDSMFSQSVMEVFLFRLIDIIDFIISIPNSYRYIFLFNHFTASFMIYLIIYRIFMSHFQFCSIVFMSLLNLLNLGINRLIEMHFNLGCSLLTFLYCYTNSSFLNNHNFKIH